MTFTDQDRHRARMSADRPYRSSRYQERQVNWWFIAAATICAAVVGGVVWGLL